MQFEFLIPKRPVSLQTRNRSKLQDWQAFVRAEALKTWVGTPYSGNVHLALVYLYDPDNQASRIQAPGFIRPQIKKLYPMKLAPQIYPWGQGFNSKI